MNNAHDKPENIKCCRSSGLLLFIKVTHAKNKSYNFILKVDITFPVTSILDSRGFFLEFTSVLGPAIFFHSFIRSSCGFVIVERSLSFLHSLFYWFYVIGKIDRFLHRSLTSFALRQVHLTRCNQRCNGSWEFARVRGFQRQV